MNDVIVVGAGPVGLMLAAELRLAGVDVVVLEKLDAPTGLSKALGITGRGEDYLAMRGLLERFRARAPAAPRNVFHFALIPLDITKTSLTPKGIFVPQAITEDILEQRARELGVVIRRGVTVTSFDETGDGVDVATERGPFRAHYVVGCDGGRSTVRHAAGIGFTGTQPTSIMRLGDLQLADGYPVPSMFVPLGDGWYRLITKEPLPASFDLSAAMTLEELLESAARVFHIDVPVREARWVSRFTDASRQADAYRRGRMLIAGDAAHIHLPAGGPGLVTGFGDALNLGWKLAAVVRGRAPDAILDSYDAERRPVAARVLEHTRAQGVLTLTDEANRAMRALVTELADIPAVIEQLLRMMWQVDVRYRSPHDSTHPLVGAYVPDALRSLLSGDPGRWLAIGSIFDDNVDRLEAKRIASSSIAGSVLVRPDGHVAWAGDAPDQSLAATISAWT